MIYVEWVCAVLLCLSIWWYPEQRGWKSVAAPALSWIGCLGFAMVAAVAGAYGIATLNAILFLVNARNVCIAWERL